MLNPVNNICIIVNILPYVCKSEKDLKEYSTISESWNDMIENYANHIWKKYNSSDSFVKYLNCGCFIAVKASINSMSKLSKLIANCEIEKYNKYTNSYNYYPIHIASARGDLNIVKMLLEVEANVNVIDSNHNTPLHLAAHNGHIEIVKILLSVGANKNLLNCLKHNARREAYSNDHVDIILLLSE